MLRLVLALAWVVSTANAQGSPTPSVAGGSLSQVGNPTASWVFGGVLLVFLMAVVACDLKRDVARPFPPETQKILGFFCAVLAGLFGFFFTGTIAANVNPTTGHGSAGMSIQATGGSAFFVVVLWWWRSDKAPLTGRPNKLRLWIQRSWKTVGGSLAGILICAAGVGAFILWPPPAWTSRFESPDTLRDWSGQIDSRELGNPSGVCKSELPDTDRLVIKSKVAPVLFLPSYKFEDFTLGFLVDLCQYQTAISWVIRSDEAGRNYYRFDLDFDSSGQRHPGEQGFQPAFGKAKITGQEYRNGRISGAPLSFAEPDVPVSSLYDDQQLWVYLRGGRAHGGGCEFSYDFCSVVPTNEQIDRIENPADKAFIEKTFFPRGFNFPEHKLCFPKVPDHVPNPCLQHGTFGFLASKSVLRLSRVEINNADAVP